LDDRSGIGAWSLVLLLQKWRKMQYPDTLIVAKDVGHILRVVGVNLLAA
jgi:hypothetical protein